MDVNSQLQIVKQDKWLLACLTWVPVLLAFLMWSIFSQGIARDLPIAVVDLSHSQLSRDLTQNIEATPALAITRYYQSIHDAKNAMVESKIYGYVVIPAQFDVNIYQGLQPQVSVFYNSQFVLIGKLVNAAIIQAQGNFNAKLGVAKSLSKGNINVPTALTNTVNIQIQITPLFNKNTNYSQFLLTAIIPALWQIFIVAGTILILTAIAKNEGLQSLLDNGYSLIIKKLLCYFPLFLLHGLIFLWWFYQGFSWPMQGSLFVLIFGQILTVLACMIMGAFFYFLSLDATRALSLAGAFTAPSFAFMGITFPVSDMNVLAQLWRSLLPISHYIEVQVGQASYSATTLSSLKSLLPMFAYLIPLLLTGLLISKHQQNQKVAI